MRLKTKITIGATASALGTIIGTIALEGIDFLFRFIVSFLTIMWHTLIAHLPVPVWLLLPVTGWILFSVFRGLIAIFYGEVKPLSERDYTQDNFFALAWRWTYSKTGINAPHGYCPKCDTRLFAKITQPHPLDKFHGAQDETTFYCETCQCDLAKFDGDLIRIQGKVVRQIDRNTQPGYASLRPPPPKIKAEICSHVLRVGVFDNAN